MKRNCRSWSVVAVLAICVATASCGSDDAAETTAVPEATTATTAAPEATTAATVGDTSASTTAGGTTGDACADRDALRASVAALADVDVVAEGTNGLTAAVDAVKSDLEKVRASAGSVVGSQVQAVQDALAAIEAGLGKLGNGGAAAVSAALPTLSTATAALLTSIQEGPCG